MKDRNNQIQEDLKRDGKENCRPAVCKPLSPRIVEMQSPASKSTPPSAELKSPGSCECVKNLVMKLKSTSYLEQPKN